MDQRGGMLERVCKRCKQLYNQSANTPCRFHPSFFVSRRHDDQQRFLVLGMQDDSMIDTTKYYELKPGDPPYAAKFYDCCGAENPDAAGCKTDFHASYDD